MRQHLSELIHDAAEILAASGKQMNAGGARAIRAHRCP